MGLLFLYIKSPAWVDSSGCEVHLSDCTLVHWLKINQLFNAVSFDVLTAVSVIMCQYATICCLYFTNQDVGSDQYLQVESRTQWLI